MSGADWREVIFNPIGEKLVNSVFEINGNKIYAQKGSLIIEYGNHEHLTVYSGDCYFKGLTICTNESENYLGLYYLVKGPNNIVYTGMVYYKYDYISPSESRFIEYNDETVKKEFFKFLNTVEENISLPLDYIKKIELNY